MVKLFLAATLCFAFGIHDAEASRNQKRERNQQARIRQGVKSGELNKREAYRLRQGQKRVDNMQQKFKADGELSAAEKMRLEKAQDVQSKRIYKQKHDTQSKNPVNETQSSATPSGSN